MYRNTVKIRDSALGLSGFVSSFRGSYLRGGYLRGGAMTDLYGILKGNKWQYKEIICLKINMLKVLHGKSENPNITRLTAAQLLC